MLSKKLDRVNFKVIFATWTSPFLVKFSRTWYGEDFASMQQIFPRSLGLLHDFNN